jgi:hypothetical protein
MADDFSTPWLVFRKGDKTPKGTITAHPGAAFIVYFLKIRGEYDPVINLIRRAPSMLALLEKAYPIIEEEAERRTHSYSPKKDRYWVEMIELRDAISAEIDRARGKEDSHG